MVVVPCKRAQLELVYHFGSLLVSFGLRILDIGTKKLGMAIIFKFFYRKISWLDVCIEK